MEAIDKGEPVQPIKRLRTVAEAEAATEGADEEPDAMDDMSDDSALQCRSESGEEEQELPSEAEEED